MCIRFAVYGLGEISHVRTHVHFCSNSYEFGLLSEYITYSVEFEAIHTVLFLYSSSSLKYLQHLTPNSRWLFFLENDLKVRTYPVFLHGRGIERCLPSFFG